MTLTIFHFEFYTFYGVYIHHVRQYQILIAVSNFEIECNLIFMRQGYIQLYVNVDDEPD